MKKVFGTVEEMKWFFHAKLCKHEDEWTAHLILDMMDTETQCKRAWTPKEANKWLKGHGYKVKE